MPETDEQAEPTPCSARAKNKTEYERPNAKTETETSNNVKWFESEKVKKKCVHTQRWYEHNDEATKHWYAITDSINVNISTNVSLIWKMKNHQKRLLLQTDV